MANTLAYGFIGLENLMAQRLSDTSTEVIRDAVGQSVDEHNRQAQELLSELAVPTTQHKVRFKQPGGGTLQPLDDKGNPVPVREQGHYDVAYPIQGGGTAWGDNRVTRNLMTVGEVNEHVLGGLRRDAEWMRRHVLAALLDNVSWTFEDDLYGSLDIEPLANDDSVEYLRRNGDLETDDHYYAQASDIDDSNNPFPTIHAELVEHPVNQGATIVAYVATDLTADIKALGNFDPVLDTDVTPGNDQNRLTSIIPRGVGDEVLGKVDKVWIVEYSQLPDGYMLVVARGTTEPILKMREHNSPALQGLFEEVNSPDGNSQEYRFIRYAGFGVHNRVGAVAAQIGNATYQVPTSFDAPLDA